MSEFEWIARYFAPLVKTERAAGLLDDVAELSGRAQIITTDALVEGVHFLPTDPIDTVARKLVRVNVSDIIAKGARPDEAVLTLGWPRERDEAQLAAFASALGEELDHWGANLIGGDTVASPEGLFISLTLTGTHGETERLLRRSGAKPGDDIWITGTIGLGGQGLADAKSGRDTPARAHYRVPDIPPLSLTKSLQAYAGAAMDISDGLIGDLQKLCVASNLGADLKLDTVPISGVASTEPSVFDILAACIAGDDYQCLFTAPKAAKNALARDEIGFAHIGVMTAESGVKASFNETAVELPKRVGFEHKT